MRYFFLFYLLFPFKTSVISDVFLFVCFCIFHINHNYILSQKSYQLIQFYCTLCQPKVTPPNSTSLSSSIYTMPTRGNSSHISCFQFPQNGELVLKRLVVQFRRGYRRNDKALCLSSTQFVAHLVNQQVVLYTLFSCSVGLSVCKLVYKHEARVK